MVVVMVVVFVAMLVVVTIVIIVVFVVTAMIVVIVVIAVVPPVAIAVIAVPIVVTTSSRNGHCAHHEERAGCQHCSRYTAEFAHSCLLCALSETGCDGVFLLAQPLLKLWWVVKAVLRVQLVRDAVIHAATVESLRDVFVSLKPSWRSRNAGYTRWSMETFVRLPQTSCGLRPTP
jgi:hypothetical protein